MYRYGAKDFTQYCIVLHNNRYYKEVVDFYGKKE